jgi:hypothetical protein
MLEDAEARLWRLEGAVAFDAVFGVITTISPGSTSRTNSAPMMSSAQVSEDSTQPSPRSAQHQRAHAQRVAHADQLGRVIATTENAPSTRRSASFIRSGMCAASSGPSGG